jgi:hypothetical protein
MGNTLSEDEKMKKIMSIDIDDFTFRSDDPICENVYNFIYFLKNRQYSTDNGFVNKLNVNYFLVVKYLARITHAIEYLSGNDREYFIAVQKLLDDFLKKTNHEINDYIKSLELSDKQVLSGKNTGIIKRAITNIIKQNKAKLRHSLVNMVTAYSSKLSHNTKLTTLPFDLSLNLI